MGKLIRSVSDSQVPDQYLDTFPYLLCTLVQKLPDGFKSGSGTDIDAISPLSDLLACHIDPLDSQIDPEFLKFHIVSTM